MTDKAVTDLDLSQSDLEALVARVLEQAARRGATQAEAAVSVEAGLSVTVRLGEVETLEYQRDRGLGVTVYFGHRKGSASSADLDPAAVERTVEKACTIARYTAEDEYSGLADPELMAGSLPDLDLLHPWEITPERAIEVATGCEAAARAFDQRINNSEGSTVTSHRGLRIYGNSHGFVGGYGSTGHSISCAVVAASNGAMERDYWYTAARDAADLEPAESVGRRAGERTVRRLDARKIATCRVPVLFPPELARGLIGHFVGAIRGSAQYRRASFLLDARGQRVFPGYFNISERPHLPKGMGSAPIDNEGVATRDRELVVDGVLQGYVLGSYSARKLGLKTTGNAGGVHNLIVHPSAGGFEALLRQMGRGFLVGELMGQGVNGVTGDYSRGAAGFWVEDGQIRYPVHEVTIAGNLRDMLANLVAVGNDVDERGRIRTGSILVAEMTVAGD